MIGTIRSVVGGGRGFLGAVIVKTPSEERVDVTSFGLIPTKECTKSTLIYQIIGKRAHYLARHNAL